MLRFTLHRPSQNSAVFTCCHGMPCRDVSGRVHVGVRPVPASQRSGRSQLCGLGVKPGRGAFPTPPHQALLQAKVPHIPGVSVLLGQEHLLCNARITAESHGPQRSAGLRHPCRNQTPKGVVAASTMITRFTSCSSPRIAATYSRRRCSTGANTSWRRWVRTSGRRWPSSTENKTMFTCSCSTRPRWRSPTSSTPAKASHPGGRGRTSPAGSTRLRAAARSDPRHPSPDHAVAHNSPQARTTSPIRNDQIGQGFLPARKGTVSTPDRQ
jgi:hypothetical protein